MANDYYTPDGTPGTGAFGASAPMRTEFSLIALGFDKLPALSGLAAGTAVIVNTLGTGLTNTTGTLALAGAFATTGAFALTLVAGAAVTLTLPVVSGTLATLAGVETLSNKTLVAPALGTPASGIATNLTGTASGLTVGHATSADSATTATTATTVTTNANLTGVITSVGNATSIGSQTGTGTKFVVDTGPTLQSPVLVTAALGTPASGVLTNATGYPVANLANLGAGVATFLATPSSANLLTAVTDETGSGALVFGTGPTINGATLSGAISGGGNQINNVVIGASTPLAGTFTTLAATTVNGNTITTGSGVLTLAAAKTLTVSNSLTLAGSDATTMTFPSTSATIARTDAANTFTGHQTIEGVTSTGATGTGQFVFHASPTLITPALGTVASGNIAACTGFPTATGATTFMTADAACVSANTFVNGPNTGSIGANGQTWEITAGGSYFNGSGGNMTGAFRIFNGTSDIIDGQVALTTGFSAGIVLGPLVVTLTGATTFTLQTTDNIGGSAGILKATATFTGAATNKATWITAVRLS